MRENESIGDYAQAKVGLQTGDNNRFLRYWFEVETLNIGFSLSGNDIERSDRTWFPCNKGGNFRKWYGNHEYVVNWKSNGKELKSFKDETGKLRSRPQNTSFYFGEAISWSDVTSFSNSFRFFPKGFINDATGHSAFGGDIDWKLSLMAYCNGKFATKLAKLINPTIHFHIGYFNKLPYAKFAFNATSANLAKNATDIAKVDWDSYETSWNFTSLPLLSTDHRADTLATYARMRAHWQSRTDEMQRLEEENNRIFIDAYGLQDELTSEVPLAEITLTCNPGYRYGGGASKEALEDRLRADTMAEFLSYAVGCMFGRYSLDEPGLILANRGDGIAEYLAKIPKPRFAPNADNIVPLLDRDWVDGDATTRFHTFLRTTFGDERFEENLTFVETAIGKDVRKFFLRDFFADHLKRYKKRPIYWLFSSGPERAFQALVYLHRYDASTLARMRTEYVLPLQGRMAARIDQIEGDKLKATSTSLRKRLQKEQDDLKRQKEELKSFEEKLRHVADQRIVLDLDDGVKANYAKFGDLLAESHAIVGAMDDE